MPTYQGFCKPLLDLPRYDIIEFYEEIFCSSIDNRGTGVALCTTGSGRSSNWHRRTNPISSILWSAELLRLLPPILVVAPPVLGVAWPILGVARPLLGVAPLAVGRRIEISSWHRRITCVRLNRWTIFWAKCAVDSQWWALLAWDSTAYTFAARSRGDFTSRPSGAEPGTLIHEH
jgi:hypothetical protein